MKKILFILIWANLHSVIFAADFAFEARGLPLADVAAAVGKHYNLSIFFNTAEMGNRPVNGSLSASSEDDALRVLGFLAGAEYRREGDVILYGGAGLSWAAAPSGLLTQDQVTRMENMAVVGGYAVFKGDEITQRNLSAVVGMLTARRSGLMRLLVMDTSSVKADALQDMLSRAKIDAGLSGDIASPRLSVTVDFKSVLDFLKTDTSSTIIINNEVRMTSGESFTANNGYVRERPIYIRPAQSETDLVTSYEKTQLGFTLKIEPVWLNDKWMLRYYIEDADYIEELRRTSFTGVECISEGESKQLVSLRRNMEMKVTRGVPLFRAFSKRRPFQWTTTSGETRAIVAFLEIIGETADAGRAPARPASDASPLSLFNNKQ